MKPTILTLMLSLTTMCAGLAVDHETTPPVDKHTQHAIAAKAFKNIGVAEFEKLRSDKNNVVLDVRTAKEFEAGHMPGAINVDVNAPDFDKKAAALDPNKTYLVHCAAGVRSTKACGKLSKVNFGHLYNLEGGFRAWEKEGNKAVK